MSWTPPCRSSPSLVSRVEVTAIDPAIRPRTRSRTKRERRRSDIEWLEKGTSLVLLRRRQYQQQAAVVIVRREEIGDRLGRQIALRMHHHGLAELAHAPLQDGADMVGPAFEVEPEDLADLATHDLLVREPGELPCAPAAADDAPGLVADEESGVRRGIVVVQQLEEETEAALGASARLVPEPLLTVCCARALTAVGADEQMRHFAFSVDRCR